MTNSESARRAPAQHTGHEVLLHELRALIPSAFSDGTADPRTLARFLGVENEPQDRFRFAWTGKDAAVRAAHSRSKGALIPQQARSIGWNGARHVFIEGENLEVLKLLYSAYFGKVRLAIIGPPYNTGDEPVYIDDYSDPLGAYLRMLKDTDTSSHLSITSPLDAQHHSIWLSMMYPRIVLARQLLREDGFLVVGIDDEELHHLRMLLNETLGEENHIATLVWDRSRKNDAKLFSVGHEYMVVYAKNANYLADADLVLRMPKAGLDEIRELFSNLRATHGDDFTAIERELGRYYRSIEDVHDPRTPLKRYRKVDAGGPYRDDTDISWHGGGGPTYDVPHPVTGKPCRVPRRGWVYPTVERMNEEIEKRNVVFGPDETTVPARKSYLFDNTMQVMTSVAYSYSQTAAQSFQELFDGAQVYENPQHHADVRHLVEYLTRDGELVLDFFAGSATTGHAVLESNHHTQSTRRFLLVQLPEPVRETSKSGAAAKKLGLNTISEMGEERLRRVIRKLEAEPSRESAPAQDPGFRVFKLGESPFLPWPDLPLDEANLELFVNRVRPGASNEAIVWEIALREGYPLSSQIDDLSLPTCSIYRVSDGTAERRLHVCLGPDVRVDLPEILGLASNHHLICPDGLLTDELAANLSLQCRLTTY